MSEVVRPEKRSNYQSRFTPWRKSQAGFVPRFDLLWAEASSLRHRSIALGIWSGCAPRMIAISRHDFPCALNCRSSSNVSWSGGRPGLPLGTNNETNLLLRFTYSCQRAGTFCSKLSYFLLTASWSNSCSGVPAAAYSESSPSVSDSASRYFLCQTGSDDRNSSSSLTGSWGCTRCPYLPTASSKASPGHPRGASTTHRAPANDSKRRAKMLPQGRLRHQVIWIPGSGVIWGSGPFEQVAEILDMRI